MKDGGKVDILFLHSVHASKHCMGKYDDFMEGILGK